MFFGKSVMDLIHPSKLSAGLHSAKVGPLLCSSRWLLHISATLTSRYDIFVEETMRCDNAVPHLIPNARDSASELDC